MEFLVLNMLYKLVGVLIALAVIFLAVRKFRKYILKDSLKDSVSTDPKAIAILEGLYFIGMVILASKVIPQ